MMENSGMMSLENRTQSFFRKISFSSERSSSFLRPVFIPYGFMASDVKFVSVDDLGVSYSELSCK